MNQRKIAGPPLWITVEPKVGTDREKLWIALAHLASEDSAYSLRVDSETDRFVLSGNSEPHLSKLVDSLHREFKGNLSIGAPQVAYRETVSLQVELMYTHKRQTSGSGQFAAVSLMISPAIPGEGNSFDSKDTGGSVPMEYVLGVEKGINSVMDDGPIAGFPVVDCKVALTSGSYREVDSSALAFEIAARACTRDGIKKAGPKLLEPIMKVEVVTPKEYSDLLSADLIARRGVIDQLDRRGGVNIIDAFVPLSTMFGYESNLGYMTSGRGKFTLDYAHHAPLPANTDPDDLFPMAKAMRA
jgi:elongation factor G